MQLKSVVVGAITLGLCLSLGSQNQILRAEQKKETASETRGTRVKDGVKTNLPSGKVTNDPKDAKPAPASKGGTRGGYYSAEVQFVNRTSWKIQLFANGDYLGILAPYGSSSVPVTSGRLTLQGRADFTDGSSTLWGPRNIYIASGDVFTWTLSPP